MSHDIATVHTLSCNHCHEHPSPPHFSPGPKNHPPPRFPAPAHLATHSCEFCCSFSCSHPTRPAPPCGTYPPRKITNSTHPDPIHPIVTTPHTPAHNGPLTPEPTLDRKLGNRQDTEVFVVGDKGPVHVVVEFLRPHDETTRSSLVSAVTHTSQNCMR